MTDADRRPLPAVLLLLRGIGCVLAFIVVQGIGFELVRSASGPISTSGLLNVDGALAISAVQAVGIVAVALLVHGGITTWQTLGMRASRARVREGLRQLAPMGLIVVLPTIVYVLLTGGTLIAPRIDVTLGAVLVLLAVLIAVNEELWFRGLVLQALGAPARGWFVVLASALLFGLPHASDSPASWLNAAAVTLAVGIPFAVVRLVSTALLPLIFWHAIIDIWAFLHTASVTPVGDPSLEDVLAALTLPGVVALAYLAWWLRQRRVDAGS